MAEHDLPKTSGTFRPAGRARSSGADAEATLETRLIRYPSCGVANRVPLDRVEAGLRPVCGRCKAPVPIDLEPVT